MANDYNGYIATYREYQRGDHYRKALTGWGPHSSDYFATRLVGLGRSLNGGCRDTVSRAARRRRRRPTSPHNDARAKALGETAAQGRRPTRTRCRTMGGRPRPSGSPSDIERFDAALFTWNGGDNYIDDPRWPSSERSTARGGRTPTSPARSR